MPKISFAKKNRSEIVVSAGTNLMRALLDANVPVASSCHGDGVCAKCVVKVSLGLEKLQPPNETEIFLQEKYSLKNDQRISCQVMVENHDLTVDTTYW